MGAKANDVDLSQTPTRHEDDAGGGHEILQL